MSEQQSTEQEQRVAALMMASSGLHPEDIARALRVSVARVKKWLGQSMPKGDRHV